MPEFTPGDIAGSQAFVHDDLAREVTSIILAPDVARPQEATLIEYSNRFRAAEIAKLELHIAEYNAAAKVSLTSSIARFY